MGSKSYVFRLIPNSLYCSYVAFSFLQQLRTKSTQYSQTDENEKRNYDLSYNPTL